MTPGSESTSFQMSSQPCLLEHGAMRGTVLDLEHMNAYRRKGLHAYQLSLSFVTRKYSPIIIFFVWVSSYRRFCGNSKHTTLLYILKL